MVELNIMHREKYLILDDHVLKCEEVVRIEGMDGMSKYNINL